VNRACGWASPQRHRPVRRPQLAQLLPLLCVAAALGLAACGSTRSASISTSTPPSTPAEIATPTPTVDPTDAAILNAYDQALRARRLDQRLHFGGAMRFVTMRMPTLCDPRPKSLGGSRRSGC